MPASTAHEPEYANPRSVALQVFALCGFAIAQPLFDLLGRNSTFLVVHDVGGIELVVFAIALVVIPPLAILAVLGLAQLIAPRIAWWLFCAIAGGLVALFIVPALDRAVAFSNLVWTIAMVAVMVGAALLFARGSGVRRFASYLSPAPVLFLVLFLFVSPAHVLLADSDPAAVAGPSTATTPVVMLVFDEFPLGTLVDGRGRLDAARFPGFARLAQISTWYPNATTISAETHRAVPAILSGRVPEPDAAPVAAVYPRTLFTMLGRSGPVRAAEDVTRLCPPSVCGGAQSVDPAGLVSDTSIVLGHNILPEGLESDWLPSLDGQWSDFGNEPEPVSGDAASAPDATDFLLSERAALAEQGGRVDPVELFDQFVASIHGPARPALWYGHFHFPHRAYTRLPDGTRYVDPPTWPDLHGRGDVSPTVSGFQVLRLMLQVAHADRLVSELLDRLERERMLDRALLVVVGDHGQSFQVPTDVRGMKGLTEVNRDEVLPIPLFIKYPDESRGVVDRRVTETIDILPTIVDALDAQLPDEWEFDGDSLLEPPARRPRATTFFTGATPQFLSDVRAGRMGRWIREQMVEHAGDQSDLYRLAPHGALVGRPVAELGPIAPLAGATAQLRAAASYADVDRGSGDLPAMLRARLRGVDPGYVAVALNGTIAGVGPTIVENERLTAIAMLNPEYFRDGANTVTLYEVSGDPQARSLREIRRGP